MNTESSVSNQWIEPGMYFAARKAAEQLNAFYGSSSPFFRSSYTVERWNDVEAELKAKLEN